ncbi:MAG: methyltransferase domain-containing protein [Candidatus Thorarchaeota archaeon]|nr:MAG: methyltransferase domain-containing protein [Candidatus Thorarchaeota archaeon]
MMTDRKYATPFPILQAVSLLSHKSRIHKFSQAIEKTIHSNDVVFDLGTGSGILAILAAKQGARVTAIDANAESLRYAELAAEMNGVAENIKFIHSHFYDFKPQEKADVILCEMLSSVMLIEQQIPASRYAVSHLLKTDGTIMPQKVKLFVVPVENELLSNRFNIEGLQFPRIPQTANREQSKDLANLQELETFDLTTQSNQPASIDKQLDFEIVQSGTAHGIVGMFESKLFEDITLEMEDGWRELFLPFPKSVDTKVGDRLSIRVAFKPGEYDSLKIEIN